MSKKAILKLTDEDLKLLDKMKTLAKSKLKKECVGATRAMDYIGNGLMHPDKSVFFFENGSVCIGEEVFTHRTYEQMLKIMEALQ